MNKPCPECRGVGVVRRRVAVEHATAQWGWAGDTRYEMRWLACQPCRGDGFVPVTAADVAKAFRGFDDERS